MDTFIGIITYAGALLVTCFIIVWLIDKTPAKYRIYIGKAFIVIGILFPLAVLLMFLLDQNDNTIISLGVLIKAVIAAPIFISYSVNIVKKANIDKFFDENCIDCQYCSLTAYSKGQQWCNSPTLPFNINNKCTSKVQVITKNGKNESIIEK